MKAFNEMTTEERLAVYNDTIGGIACCCDYDVLDFDDMDGICPDCGRATCGGECVCRCCYSPVECDTCGAAPCGGYC